MEEELCKGCGQPRLFCECRWDDVPEPFTPAQQAFWIILLSVLAIALFIVVL